MSRKINIAFSFFFLSTTFGLNYDVSAEEEIPEWGFYVYMAGDNTLTDEVEDDLNEMRLVGSNENRVIVALTDQINGDDSHAYQIKKSGFIWAIINCQIHKVDDSIDLEKNTKKFSISENEGG